MNTALAIYNTDGSTNALVSALRRHLAQPDSFGSISREFWWFREDERLQNVLLPMNCPRIGDQTRPVTEREEIVQHLGDVTSIKPLPRKTLEALLDPGDETSFGEAVRRGLSIVLNPAEPNHAEIRK